MAKMTTIKTPINIIAYGQPLAVPAEVNKPATGTVRENGRDILKAGAIVGGGRILNPQNRVSVVNDGTAEGVLLQDVDVTDGTGNGKMVVMGDILLKRMTVQPSAAAKAAMRRIEFWGGI